MISEEREQRIKKLKWMRGMAESLLKESPRLYPDHNAILCPKYHSAELAEVCERMITKETQLLKFSVELEKHTERRNED